MSYLICLDAGHGGNDSGAVGPTNLHESDVNLQVCRLLGEKLKRIALNVTQTRSTDVFVNLSARCSHANSHHADFFISIHCNSDGPSAEGVECLVQKQGSTAYHLAAEIQPQLVDATDDTDRGIKIRTDLAVLNGTSMPAVLCEIGFISHAETEEDFRDPGYLELISAAVRDGIAKFLNIEPHQPVQMV